MRRRKAVSILVLAVAVMLCVVPDTALGGNGETQVLKVAVMIPRNSTAVIEVKRYNKRLAEMTDGAVQARVYWGGVAGDEKDVLRKMRNGQIDGSPLSLELMSRFVREALVLASPGLFANYKQVDAARAALTPAFDEEAYQNGFKVMAWGDAGRLRLFSKTKITRLDDLRRARPWLYPESQMLREFYKIIGATGVPLGIPEVYGGMQTGMIDTYWASAVLAAALQWHRTSKFVSASGLGVISGAFVFRRPTWDALPDNVKNSMIELADETRQKNQIELRKTDEKAFRRLLNRGYTALTAENPEEWYEAGHKLRRRMVGRIYTEKLVAKAEKIAKKYADKEQLAHWQ